MKLFQSSSSSYYGIIPYCKEISDTCAASFLKVCFCIQGYGGITISGLLISAINQDYMLTGNASLGPSTVLGYRKIFFSSVSWWYLEGSKLFYPLSSVDHTFHYLGVYFCQWKCIGGMRRQEMNLEYVLWWGKKERKDNIAMVLFIHDIFFVW